MNSIIRSDLYQTEISIARFIQQTSTKLNRDGAVIGLSGGLDSAVTAELLLRALGKDKVHLVSMPERDSNPIHIRHARRFTAEHGMKLVSRPITKALRGLGSYRLLPIHLIPFRWLRERLVLFGKANWLDTPEEEVLSDRLDVKPGSWIAKGNAYGIAKHRARMATLYQYAEVRNLMVVGAANYTEYLTGTFSKWGVDHCADIMPIMHLYRSQVEQLAKHLDIPAYIQDKPADPDILPGINDKGLLLGDFEAVDQILNELLQNTAVDTLKLNFDPVLVDRIHLLYQRSAHMRESPYWLG